MSGAFTPIDSTVEVVTPENVAFRYTVAGPFRRLPAFLIDLLVRVAIMFLLRWAAMLVGFTAGFGVAVAGMLIVWFLLDWFYGGVFETLMNGQTPGKRIMGVRVLSVDGQPINGIQAVLRNILRSADMMPLVAIDMSMFGAPPILAYILPSFMLGLVAMSLNHRFQRIGDLVSGTIVVIEERRWLSGVARLDDPRAAQLANYIPADYVISRTLARALSDYVDRRRFFSAARRREVARHVAEPLLDRFGFPPDTSYDLLLCALYYRSFIADRSQDDRPILDLDQSPFAAVAVASPDDRAQAAPPPQAPVSDASIP